MIYKKILIKDESAMVRPGITMAEVIRAVSRHYKVTPSDLVSRRRTNDVVFPRHVAMYLCAKLTPNSYPQIGRRFERDHTTALYGARKVDHLIRHNDDVCSVVRELTLAIRPEQREAAE